MFYSLATWYFVNNNFLAISQCEGASMNPTFDSGTILVIDRLMLRKKQFNKGDVIVAIQPTNPKVQICKRVTNVEGETVHGILIPPNYVWLEGDNKNASFDSRSYGPIPNHLIKGRVIKYINFE